MTENKDSASVTRLPVKPRIIPRPEHNISRTDVSKHALKVLYRLKNAGYCGYLVGGCVRDLLMGREPKDFDVATDALPEQVRELFRNCRLIGRRFRLAHIYFGREVIEVATFRASHELGGQGDGHTQDGRIVRDNVYGTLDDDVWRRDFTINAIYYDISDFSIIDYAGGIRDLQQGVLRTIGDPERRYREDPVRMLRAVRFAVKLGFKLHPQTAAPLAELGNLLEEVPSSRLYEEVLKLFMGGCALQSFEQLRHVGLFRYLFPQTEDRLSEQEKGFPLTLLVRALDNTDKRVREGKPVTPAFLFAALLWDPVRHYVDTYLADGLSLREAIALAGDRVISQQVARVSLPRRFSLITREIWAMQPRLEAGKARRAMRVLGHPRFRAAYDFLVLRAESGEAVGEAAAWWTQLQAADEAGQSQMVTQQSNRQPRHRRTRRRPPRPE